MENELLLSISSIVSYETRSILTNKAKKFNVTIEPEDSGIRYKILAKSSIKKSIVENSISPKSHTNIWATLKLVLWIICVIIVLWLVAELISSKLHFSLLVSFFIELALIIFLGLIILGVLLIIKKTYSVLENKYKNISIQRDESVNENFDEVYTIISSTYETLSDFRKERERQAKNSYNAALGLIIAGILIVFSGVILLYQKSIVEGSVTSSVGAISNIIGGTILKFYKETNNRMDSLNNDLFTLNTAKVQYAIILKISDSKSRDKELSKLISSIGSIKKVEILNLEK